MIQHLHASEIAAKVNAGAISALDIAEQVLARLADYDQIQPQAWISRFAPDDIRAAAKAVDARVMAGEVLPLAGVPFAVKDNIDVAGLDTTAACPEFAYRPVANAFVVERLLAAGAICIGKTNLDQFATGLNGSRSPYGAPRCVFNLDYVSGGSSSGSSVATAAGLVAFALGTDTAGSGRVPAAFNHLIGYKPSKGRWSTTGLVPACRSLDCITVFTARAADAALVDQVVAGMDAADPYSRTIPARALGQAGEKLRIGVPLPHQRNWCGDLQSERLYDLALERLEALGYEISLVDIAPLSEAAALLYNGPWVAERTAAMEMMLRDHPDAIDPAVKQIVEAGLHMTAVEAFNGQYRLQALARQAENMWQAIDVLALPTSPTIYRLKEMQAAPVALNAHFGLYTNFVNLLDMAAIAVPAGFRRNATGFGITFIAPAGTDAALFDMAARWEADSPYMAPELDMAKMESNRPMDRIRLAVVGAHLKDMPLHWQLTSRDAIFIAETTTAPSYKLYAIANSVPPKPALVHDAAGAAIKVEVYELSTESFGSFTAEVPPPLAIGTVTLADGSQVKGFVAEPRALIGAEDITTLGGWRAYLAG
ncbi:allophanate hydrolase [Aquisediminimonas sediminicola]|uniref:allophanate hydrolase n=1 Tax=Alteraquisediminimonas sediminicola TaxID=2676787 RepID=UPI001C8E6CD4|nr:allophanate hydrolase [Aquisediminimonas sediminicola]